MSVFSYFLTTITTIFVFCYWCKCNQMIAVYHCRRKEIVSGGITKKIFSSGIIFLGYKSNFQKSGGGHAPQPSRFLRHCFLDQKMEMFSNVSDVVNVNPIFTGGGGWRGGIHPKPFFQHYSEMRKDFLLKLGNFFH